MSRSLISGISVRAAYERAHPIRENVERVYVRLRRGFGEAYHLGEAVRFRREWLVPAATEYVLEHRGPTLCGKRWGELDTATTFPPADLRLCRVCERLSGAPGPAGEAGGG